MLSFHSQLPQFTLQLILKNCLSYIQAVYSLYIPLCKTTLIFTCYNSSHNILTFSFILNNWDIIIIWIPCQGRNRVKIGISILPADRP